jgi:hypothetical protein
MKTAITGGSNRLPAVELHPLIFTAVNREPFDMLKRLDVQNAMRVGLRRQFPNRHEEMQPF